MVAEVVHLESEPARAERYTAQMTEALKPVLALMDDAKQHGLLIEFQLGMDAYGRAVIASSAVVKRY